MQRNSSDYKVVFSTKTYAFAEQYREALTKGKATPGEDFCGSLAQHWIDTYSKDKAKDQKALNALLTAYPYGGNGREFWKGRKPTLSDLLRDQKLTTETFLALLLRTKRPVVFAESGIYGDHRDWNPQEMYILGNANVFVKDVTVYDSGERKGQIALVYGEPHPKCTYIYTPGVLLASGKGGLLSTDRSEVTDKEFNLDEKQFIATYIERLLPVLIEANNAARDNSKKAFINLPGLGAGCFAGDYDQSTIKKYLKNAIKQLIEQHHHQLKNISAICLDLYDDQEQSTIRIPAEAEDGIDFILSPAEATELAHLQKPEAFGNKYKDNDWYVFVAYDHVAMIDNEANHNRKPYEPSLVKETENLKELKIEPGKIYLQYSAEGLKYRLLGLQGEEAEGLIPKQTFGREYPLSASAFTLDFLKNNFRSILKYTQDKQQTTPATYNRGESDEAAKGSASNAAERVFGIKGKYEEKQGIFTPIVGGSYRSQIITEGYVFQPNDKQIIHRGDTSKKKSDYRNVYSTFTQSYQKRYEAVRKNQVQTRITEATRWFHEADRPKELKAFYETMFEKHDHKSYYYYAYNKNIRIIHDKVKALHNIASQNKNPRFKHIHAFLIATMKSAYTPSGQNPEDILNKLQHIIDGFNDNASADFNKFLGFKKALTQGVNDNLGADTPLLTLPGYKETIARVRTSTETDEEPETLLYNNMDDVFAAIDRVKWEKLDKGFPKKKGENDKTRADFFSFQTKLRLCLTDFLLDPKPNLQALRSKVGTLILQAERLLDVSLIHLRDAFDNSVMSEEKFYEKLYRKEKSIIKPDERLPPSFIPIRQALLRSLRPPLKEEKKEAKKESEVRVYATPTWKKWAEEDAKQNPTRILRFTKPGDVYLFPEEEYTRAEKVLPLLEKKGAFASNWSAENAAHDRTFTKHRVIVTEIKPYTPPKEGEAKSVSIITACAPNMMKDSSAEDRHRFSEGKDEQKNRTLKKDEYKTACEELANLICAAAAKEGKKEIVMPDFGLGAYIETLDDSSQKVAKEIMREAFYNAAYDHNVQITWIIYEGKPDDEKAKERAIEEVSILNKKFIALDEKFGKADSALNFKTGDLLKEMRQAAQTYQPYKLFLNPGSDRTIGGKYLEYRNPKTLEEKIAGEYDLVLQSSVLNPAVVAAFTSEKVISIKPKAIAAIEAEAKVEAEIALEIQSAKIDAEIAELEEQLKAEEQKKTALQKTAPKPTPPSTSRSDSHTKPPAPTRAPPPPPGKAAGEKNAPPIIYPAGGSIIPPPLPKSPPPISPPPSALSLPPSVPPRISSDNTTDVDTNIIADEEEKKGSMTMEDNNPLKSSSSVLEELTAAVEKKPQLPASDSKPQLSASDSMTSPPISIWRTAFNEVFNAGGRGFIHYFLNLPEWKGDASWGSKALRIASGFCAVLISPLTFMINAFIRLPFETLFKMGELSFKRDASKPNWPNYLFGAASSLVRYLFSFNPIKAYQECSHKDARSAQFFSSFLGDRWGKQAGGLWGVLLSLVGMIGMTLVVPVAITGLVSIASSSTATTVTNGFTMVDNFLNFSATSAGVSISALDTAGTGLAALAVAAEATVSSTKTIFDTMGSKPAGIPVPAAVLPGGDADPATPIVAPVARPGLSVLPGGKPK